MLWDMDHMEASCITYVKISTFDQLEHSKMSVLTVTALETVMLTVYHDLIVSVSFMYDPGDYMRHTSPDVISVEECPFYILPTWDFGCLADPFIPVNKQTTSVRLTANCRTVWNPCNLQLHAARLILSKTCKFAITHSILTWSYLYIRQDFPLLFVITFLEC